MSKRILVIKHGALGDFILTLGYFATLKKMHPHDHMTLLTMSPFKKMGELSGFFDEVLIDNRPKHQLHLWWHVCKNVLIDGKYDIIYDLQQSNRTEYKYLPVLRFFSRHSFVWAFPYRKTQHHIQKKRALSWGENTTSTLDMPKKIEPIDLRFCHGEGKYFHELPKRFVLLIPGCSPTHPYKRWPAEYYADIAKRLGACGIHSVVLGTKDEEVAIQTICHDNPMAISFMNKSSLLDIPQIVARSLAVIGNDTGPSHMASVCHKETIVLFSHKTCQSANHFPNVVNLIAQNICDITPEQVWEQLQKWEIV